MCYGHPLFFYGKTILECVDTLVLWKLSWAIQCISNACWDFNASVCKCHSKILLYPNLQLMTTGVKIVMKSLTNALARQELEISNGLTQLVIYSIKTMHAFCYDHCSELVCTSTEL